MSLTRRDLVSVIAAETNFMPMDVQVIVKRVFDLIADRLTAGEHIEFRGFGVFEIKERKARVGRNPNKPDAVVQIPPRKVVKFKAGKELRDRVAGTQPPPRLDVHR